MANDTAASGASATTNSQANTDQRSTSASTTDDSSASGASTSQETIRDPDAKARADTEAAQRVAQKTRIQELEAKVKAFEDAKLTEAERAEKKTAEALREKDAAIAAKQEQIARLTVKNAAQARGLNPLLVAKVIDLESIEYDANGEPKNLEKLLDQAIKDYDLAPAQTVAAQPNSGAVGAPARSATGQTAVTPQQYADYSFHESYAKQHNGQSLTEARRLGLVRVTG